MPSNDLYLCRVCGYCDEDAPWGEDGASPTFNFCVCCGVEHGYEDVTPESARRYREAWLRGGAQWHHPRFKPADWDAAAQLAQVPERFR
jgi:hypothetical protein